MKSLQNWFQELKQSNIPVIVEGKKDKLALQDLGVKSIYTLSRKPIYAIAEEISSNSKECIILTDLDKKGKLLFSKLSHDLQRMGVKINNKFRNYLYKETKISNIECLNKFI